MKTPWIHQVFEVLKSGKWQVFLLFVFIAALFIIYSGYASFIVAEKFWKVIDPVAGISTFVITLVILYNQLRARWESGLEKQLDVEYKFTQNTQPQLIFAVLGAYLASESDIRAWAQQLASQVAGQQKFDVNWDDPKPFISFDSQRGKYVKTYRVTLFLTEHPLLNEIMRKNIQEFLNRRNSLKYSKIIGQIDELPIIWLSSDKDPKLISAELLPYLPDLA